MLKLNDYWYIAAPSSELRKKPIRRELEGETIVLFRDSAGKACALEDRCRHRGMALSEGQVRNGCVECPYHGWRYSATGEVAHVPALLEGETLGGCGKVRSFFTQERDEHIWIWLGKEEPTTEPLGFPHCGDSGWQTFFMHTRFNAPVESCLENFLDVPHTIFVHPGLFRNEDQKETKLRIHSEGDSVEVAFLDETPLAGLGPRLVFPRDTSMSHTDRFILPATTRVDYGFGEEHRFIITSQCTQRQESVVDVTTAITWRLPIPSFVVKPFLKFYCRRVIQQDVEVLDILGKQLKKFGNTMTHTRADVLGRHISRLRRRAAEGLHSNPRFTEEQSLRI